MNRKQRLILITGLSFMGVNLLFPRDFHGWKYHFFTTVHEYQQPEMIARQLTLLALLLTVILLLRVGEKALNRRQKVVLLGSLAIWLLIFLFPPNHWEQWQRCYFTVNWDAREADYSFANILFCTLLTANVVLIPILGHKLSVTHITIVIAALILPWLSQLFYYPMLGEDRPFINDALVRIYAMFSVLILAGLQYYLKFGHRT